MNSVSFNSVTAKNVQNTKKEFAKGALIGAGVGTTLSAYLVGVNLNNLIQVSNTKKRAVGSLKKVGEQLIKSAKQNTKEAAKLAPLFALAGALLGVMVTYISSPDKYNKIFLKKVSNKEKAA